MKYILLLITFTVCAEPVGALNDVVTQDTVDQTVCVPNWTAAIRPPAGYTSKLKLKQMRELGLTGSPTKYEEDHFIPLELGGNPTDERNLWPEPWDGEYGAHKKDLLENHLHRSVCDKDLTKRMLLKDAQDCIKDWQACYQKEFKDEN